MITVIYSLRAPNKHSYATAILLLLIIENDKMEHLRFPTMAWRALEISWKYMNFSKVAMKRQTDSQHGNTWSLAFSFLRKMQLNNKMEGGGQGIRPTEVV